MRDIPKFIGGAGFYATCAFIDLLKKELQKSIKTSDTEFPSLTVQFDNQLAVNFNGECDVFFNLTENTCYLCFSGHPPYKGSSHDHFSLLNPLWYTTEYSRPLILCSAYTNKTKKFSNIKNLNGVYPNEVDQLKISACIHQLAGEGCLSPELLDALCNVIKKYQISHSTDSILIGCTEFLILHGEPKLSLFNQINPLLTLVETLINERSS